MPNRVIKSLVHDLTNKIAIAQGKAAKIKKVHSEDKDIDSLLLALARSVQLLASIKSVVSEGVESQDVEDAVENGDQFFKTLEKMYGIKITLDLESQRTGTPVDMDLAKMSSIIDNIVENAAKAGATEVKISDTVVGNKVHTVFEDNGRGSTECEKIGNGTFTTGGTGFGTKSIVNNIEAMGGSVRWESINGKGMRVCLTLNVSQQRKAA